MSGVPRIDSTRDNGLFTEGNEPKGRVKNNKNPLIKTGNRLGINHTKQNANDRKVSSAPNAHTIYIDERSQARKVQNRLTSNIKNTADNFLEKPRLEKQIGKKFETQLESLRKCYDALAERVKDFDKLKDSKRIALGKAITDINDLVYRLNNESVGGINKIKRDEFRSSIMCLKGKEILYKQAKADANSEDPSVRKEGEKTKKKLEKEVFDNKDLLEKNLNALGKNLDLLKQFSEFPSVRRSNIEKMLNLIQQCSLNAWVFNDVAENLRKINFSDWELRRMGILSDENKEMRELNDAALNSLK